MRSGTLLAAALGAVVVFGATPADAQNRRGWSDRDLPGYVQAPDGRVYRNGQLVYAPRGRASTRITVRKRSYLDPGTEVLPMSQSYHDYAFPPFHYPSKVADPAGARRYPLPDTWYLPGYTRF